MKYAAESGGYTVTIGANFIGRVRRARDWYEHSNGRVYAFWTWHAYTADGRDASLNNKTRADAGEYLRRYWEAQQL